MQGTSAERSSHPLRSSRCPPLSLCTWRCMGPQTHSTTTSARTTSSHMASQSTYCSSALVHLYAFNSSVHHVYFVPVTLFDMTRQLPWPIFTTIAPMMLALVLHTPDISCLTSTPRIHQLLPPALVCTPHPQRASNPCWHTTHTIRCPTCHVPHALLVASHMPCHCIPCSLPLHPTCLPVMSPDETMEPEPHLLVLLLAACFWVIHMNTDCAIHAITNWMAWIVWMLSWSHALIAFTTISVPQCIYNILPYSLMLTVSGCADMRLN